MRPIRVVHVLNQLALGGTEYNVIRLVNRLDRARFEPIIASLRDAQPSARALLASDVPIWEFHRHEGFDRRLIGPMVRRLKAQRVDVIHCHNWSTYLYGTLSARLAGVPVVIHGEHGLEADNLVEKRRRVLARMLLARLTDRFVGVSREICERIEQQWGGAVDQITFIPNGVDLTRFGQSYPAAELRASLAIASGEPVIASIGAFRAVKDFGSLVRAFDIVLRRYPRAHLLLIGSDLERRFELKLRSEAPELGSTLERVRFLGLRLDTPELLSIIDVYVNSSLYEGMSNTILEAMASRKPVVATGVGGTPDLVEDGITGLLVPPSNPEALAGRILEVLADPARAATMGLRGRERIEREHSFERMIALNADLYETLHDWKTRRPGMRTLAKVSAARLARTSGVTAIAEHLPRGTLTILTYHRILPLFEKRRSPSQSMIQPVGVFERQMAELATHYRVLTLDEVLDHYRAARPFPRSAVHVTFDDGYADNYEHALPILTRYSIPATFFLATGPLDTRRPFWWDKLGRSLQRLHGRRPSNLDDLWRLCPPRLQIVLLKLFEGGTPAMPLLARCSRLLNAADEATRIGVTDALAAIAEAQFDAAPSRLMLTWDEVRALLRHGMTLGGHTVRHAFLSELDDSAGRHEVRACLERIKAETGVCPSVFSYPAGRTSEHSRAWFAEAGVELAMTSIPGRNRSHEDHYALKRWDAGYLSVEDRFYRSQMRLELSGALDWAVRIRAYPPGS